MPSTLFGMKLMSIHILVLGNSFFKLELNNLWDTKNFLKIWKKGISHVFFLYSFSLRRSTGGVYSGAVDGATTVSAPSITPRTWWKIGCFSLRGRWLNSKICAIYFYPGVYIPRNSRDNIFIPNRLAICFRKRGGNWDLVAQSNAT